MCDGELLLLLLLLFFFLFIHVLDKICGKCFLFFCRILYSPHRQLPLLSMDQTELQRRLEEKVAELIAPPEAHDSCARIFSKPVFLPSTVFRRYTALQEADQTDCDVNSKVSNVYFFVCFVVCITGNVLLLLIDRAM